MKTSKYVQHPNSPFRSIADAVIEGQQTIDNEFEVVEQLWAKRISRDRFKLCSIPIYMYGFGILDVVKVSKEFDLLNVIAPSDMLSVRIYLLDPSIVIELIEQVAARGGRFEPYSDRLFGIAANPGEDTSAVEGYLLPLCEQGLIELEDTRIPLP